jgi:hypothetical protein
MMKEHPGLMWQIRLEDLPAIEFEIVGYMGKDCPNTSFELQANAEAMGLILENNGEVQYIWWERAVWIAAFSNPVWRAVFLQ